MDFINNFKNIPDEIQNAIKEFTIYKPKSKEELQEAVNLWCDNKHETLNRYGDISLWDTSLITDMSNLFNNKEDFNDDISKWNVSKVETTEYMFYGCKNFNQPLNNWNVSNLKRTEYMFCDCNNFCVLIRIWSNFS